MGNQTQNGETRGEQKLIKLIKTLIQSDLEFIGRPLLMLLRLKWHDRSIQSEAAIKEVAPLPTGPYLTTRKKQMGDLLLWVPRHIDSYLIDDLTGRYGYSHSSVDTGEIDAPTGKPVMAEITVGEKVERKFQDQFGDRAFARVPLAKTGVNVEQFVACVKSKFGEPYDNLEAITLGEIGDPAKEVCTGLAADCLPEKDRRRIAWARRLGLVQRASISVHSKPGAARTKEFVSPNGFAEYYGAPRGKYLAGPDVYHPAAPGEDQRAKHGRGGNAAARLEADRRGGGRGGGSVFMEAQRVGHAGLAHVIQSQGFLKVAHPPAPSRREGEKLRGLGSFLQRYAAKNSPFPLPPLPFREGAGG